MGQRFLCGKSIIRMAQSLGVLVMLSVQAASAKDSPPVKLAPGYGELNFAVPEAGSYMLPKLGMAGDGEVIESNGRPSTLHKLMADELGAGKVVLLSFIYSTCSDVNGCPLSTAVLHKIKSRLTKEPDVAAKLRLLTLSFNPALDTPEHMRAFGASFQGQGVDWYFLTTRSEQALQPILQAYRQTVDKVYDSEGRFTNTFSHNLRVYLIDQNRQIRNIYNTELLHPDMVIADIKTLLMEVDNKTTIRSESSVNLAETPAMQPDVLAPGDNKNNYDSQTYRTQSVAITERRGTFADLLGTIKNPPLGLPKVPVPEDNPITAAKIDLGRKLFYDRRLSLNNTFSCAMCHIPEQGFTSNEMATAVGVEGRTVRRNSPTLYNVAYQQSLFHDGRESSLENQVWGPLLARNEMANPSIGYVIDRIRSSQDYQGLFERAFGKPPGMETIGQALASYERSLNSGNSAFDRWYYGKDKKALSAAAQHGLELFTGKAGCSHCHVIHTDYALFTDHKLHNTGIGYEAAFQRPAASKQRVLLAPGVVVDAPASVIESVSEPKANDLGRYEISQNPKDRWRYKTPSLRNVALTAPYMHDGSIASLREVVEFYNRGGITNENLDPLIKPIGLNKDEIEALTGFLHNLTGDNTEALVSDAFAAPIGDSQ